MRRAWTPRPASRRAVCRARTARRTVDALAVADVAQIDVDPADVVERPARGLERSFEVLAHLACLLLHVADATASVRAARRHPGHEHQHTPGWRRDRLRSARSARRGLLERICCFFMGLGCTEGERRRPCEAARRAAGCGSMLCVCSILPGEAGAHHRSVPARRHDRPDRAHRAAEVPGVPWARRC